MPSFIFLHKICPVLFLALETIKNVKMYLYTYTQITTHYSYQYNFPYNSTIKIYV